MHSPASTSIMDRRRTRRYRLQPNIALTFFADNEDETSLGVGKLLNLSLDGMACKVSKTTCDTLRWHSDFLANLSVSEPTCQLRIPCQLVNAIESAEKNEFIVGVEFSESIDIRIRDQLSEVLRRREK